MPIENILHMNAGNGESSYASNSSLQETAIRKAQLIVNKTIKSIAYPDGFPRCFNIADLGCSSGPNTLLVVSNIIDQVYEVCKENNYKVPQFHVSLNDLVGNDFNTLFKSLPFFYANLKKEKGETFGPCFISAVPGSFYGRLFPDEIMHLVHSSYSNHWLSQVPKGLEDNAVNISISKKSPPNVLEAYTKQFNNDFTNFLRLRSREIVHGGHMVLTFLSRSTADRTTDDSCGLWDLLAESLLDLVPEGLVRETDINSFNLPHYFAYKDEVRNIILNEGSFSLDTLDVFQVNWDPNDTDYTNINHSNNPIHGTNTAKIVRAVMESLLASHFGNSIIDIVFNKYEKKVAKHLSIKKTRYFNLVLSLTKK